MLLASTFVKYNRSQLIVCLTLESKVLQERIHKQHLCAKQKNNKSAQFAELTVTNASILKAAKVIQIRIHVSHWNEMK